MDDGEGCWYTPSSEGMDLRDYFACHAMQALVSIPKLGMNSFNEYAVCAYKYADAMMEARNDNK